MTAAAPSAEIKTADIKTGNANGNMRDQLLSFHVKNQLFGLPVLDVNDVLGPQTKTRTPLSPRSVSGVMNLRGRIVTAIDMRACLGQGRRHEQEEHMNIVVDYEDELYSFEVDTVGDVLNLSGNTYEDAPPTLSPEWRDLSSGVHKLQNEILVVLDIKQLLQKASGKT